MGLSKDNSADEDDRSLRAELERLLRPKDTAHAAPYNEALRDAIAVVERVEQFRQERSARAIAKRKAEGKKLGGDLRYGYTIGRDGQTLVEDSAEQRVIVTARKLRSAGHSLREVARKLRARGMLSRDGTEFHAAQIKRMTDEET